ncbi:methyl-accepting chemotaxis protein [Bacillus weihaiensis]|uniref:Chemotaxis protein n=1 Tax=Bacillus weihaiensis TaxID=1547283 RepID=A0A1L3MTJ6_9BACI|nr:methyl-accepting chemotaxis protein [Bacillus weihaiensis]APH05662.1 chemotaxis protein [Bacillus weihaiensis]
MKLSIKRKIIGAFLIVSLIFGIASFVSYLTIKKSTEAYDYVIETASEIRSITQSIQTDTALQTGYYRAYMLYDDNATYRERMNEANARIGEWIKKGRELSTLQETRDRLEEIEKSNEQFNIIANRVMDSKVVSKERANEDGLKLLVPISTKLTDDTQSMHDWLKKDIVDVRVKETQEAANQARHLLIALSLFATVFAIVSGIVIGRIISTPLMKLSKLTKQVASGQLHVEKLPIKSKDEIQELNTSFEEMTDSLRQMILSISENSDQVAASAEQLNASAEQTSKATETVAQAIQQIASSSEETSTKLELNSTSLQEVLQGVLHISDSTSHVSELSKKTTEEAEQGGSYVANNLKQMKNIQSSILRSNSMVQSLSDRSLEIDKILEVINGIAEQTNLLALNAAIEAARAGEHGKGFAVVADEVRKLAEQSQLSTSNIAELILLIQKDTGETVTLMSEVVENVEEGVKVSELTSDKFSQILSSTQNISPQIEQVSATIQQISASIDEMVNTAKELSNLAQDNAASSEEVAASTEEQLASMEEIDSSAQALAKMAEQLKEVIGKFRM